jgi:hypothetical protein
MVGSVDNVMDKGKDAANGKQVSGKSTTIGNRYITIINILGGGFQGMEGLAGDCEGQESSLMEREIRGPNMMELGVQEEMDTNCTTVNAGSATSASKPSTSIPACLMRSARGRHTGMPRQ